MANVSHLQQAYLNALNSKNKNTEQKKSNGFLDTLNNIDNELNKFNPKNISTKVATAVATDIADHKVNNTNIFDTVVNDTKRLGESLFQGASRGVEGLVEFLPRVAVGVIDLVDKDDKIDTSGFTNWLDRDVGGEFGSAFYSFGSANLLNKDMYTKEYWADHGKALLSAFDNKDDNVYEQLGKYGLVTEGYKSNVGEFLGGVSESVGYMLPSIATANIAKGAGATANGARAVGGATMFAQGTGSGAQEAHREGASNAQALGYGLATGTIEALTEQIGGFAPGKSIPLSGKKALIKTLAKTMLEEGVEEAVSAMLQPVAQSIYKGKNAFYSDNGKMVYLDPNFYFGTDGDFNSSVLGQALAGAVSGAILGGSNIYNQYRSFGKDGYLAFSAFEQANDTKQRLIKLEQRGDTNSKAYQNLIERYSEQMLVASNSLLNAVENANPNQLKHITSLFTDPDSFIETMRKGNENITEAEGYAAFITNYADDIIKENSKTETAKNAIITASVEEQLATYFNTLKQIKKAIPKNDKATISKIDSRIDKAVTQIRKRYGDNVAVLKTIDDFYNAFNTARGNYIAQAVKEQIRALESNVVSGTENKVDTKDNKITLDTKESVENITKSAIHEAVHVLQSKSDSKQFVDSAINVLGEKTVNKELNLLKSDKLADTYRDYFLKSEAQKKRVSELAKEKGISYEQAQEIVFKDYLVEEAVANALSNEFNSLKDFRNFIEALDKKSAKSLTRSLQRRFNATNDEHLVKFINEAKLAIASETTTVTDERLDVRFKENRERAKVYNVNSINETFKKNATDFTDGGNANVDEVLTAFNKLRPELKEIDTARKNATISSFLKNNDISKFAIPRVRESLATALSSTFEWSSADSKIYKYTEQDFAKAIDKMVKDKVAPEKRLGYLLDKVKLYGIYDETKALVLPNYDTERQRTKLGLDENDSFAKNTEKVSVETKNDTKTEKTVQENEKKSQETVQISTKAVENQNIFLKYKDKNYPTYIRSKGLTQSFDNNLKTKTMVNALENISIELANEPIYRNIKKESLFYFITKISANPKYQVTDTMYNTLLKRFGLENMSVDTAHEVLFNAPKNIQEAQKAINEKRLASKERNESNARINEVKPTNVTYEQIDIFNYLEALEYEANGTLDSDSVTKVTDRIEHSVTVNQELIESQKKEITTLKADLKAEKTKYSILKEKLNSISSAKQAEISELKKRITESNNKIKTLTSTIKLLETRNKDLTSRIAIAKSDIKTLQNRVREEQKQINALGSTVSTYATNLYNAKEISAKDRRAIANAMTECIQRLGNDYTKKIVIDNQSWNGIARRLGNGNISGALQLVNRSFLRNMLGNELYSKVMWDHKTKVEVTEAEMAKVAKAQRALNSISELINERVGTVLSEIYANAPIGKVYNIKLEAREKLNYTNAENRLRNRTRSLKNRLESRSAYAPSYDPVLEATLTKITKLNNSSNAIANGDYRKSMQEVITELMATDEYVLLTPFDSLMEKIDYVMNAKGAVDSVEVRAYGDIITLLSSASRKTSKNYTPKSFVNDNGEYNTQTMEEMIKEAYEEQKEAIKHGMTKIPFPLKMANNRLVFQYLALYKPDSPIAKFFRGLQDSEVKYQRNILDNVKPYVKFFDDNKGFKKQLDKSNLKNIGKNKGRDFIPFEVNGVTYDNNNTSTLKLSEAQHLQIYMTSLDQDGYNHLVKGGIQDYNKKIYKFESEQALNDYLQKVANKYDLHNQESVHAKYLKEVRKVLDNLGRATYKMETDLYGHSDIDINAIENGTNTYFHLAVGDSVVSDYVESKTTVSKMQSQINYGQTKKRVKNANGAIVATDIRSLLSSYIERQCKYIAYNPILTEFNLLWNKKIKVEGQLKSMGEMYKERFGHNNGNGYAAFNFIDNLIKDLQGINPQDSATDSKLNKLLVGVRGHSARFALGLNLKTLVNQWLSLADALKYIGFTSQTKALMTTLTDNKKFKNCPLPTSVEWKAYDRSILKATTMNETFDSKLDYVLKPIEWSENTSIKLLWRAALVKCDFNVDQATRLIEKTLRETQTTSSKLDRSEFLRTKKEFWKTLQMFTVQPTQNFSNCVELFMRLKYKAKLGQRITKADINSSVRALSGIIIESILYVAIGKAFAKLLDNEDEDEWTMIGWLQDIINSLILGNIPIVNNSLQLDFDYEKWIRVDTNEMPLFATASKLIESVTSIGPSFANGKYPKAFKEFIDAIGAFAGIPTNNIFNYTTAVVSAIDYELATKIRARAKGKTFVTKVDINNQLKMGNTKKARVYYNEYTNRIIKVSPSVEEELFRLYSNGYDKAYIKQMPATYTDDEGNVLDIDRNKYMNTYKQVDPMLSKVISSTAYKLLSDEDKAKCIAKVVDIYREIAKAQFTGEELSKIESLVESGLDITKFIPYLVAISSIEKTDKKTRKELVYEYINKLPLNSHDKYTLFFLSGYSLPDNKDSIIVNNLVKNGAKRKIVIDLL